MRPQRATRRDLEEALKLAVGLLAPLEPGDSRAVSNEFVALAAVQCGMATDDVMQVIRDGIRKLEEYNA
jgi:hypothetical protein